MAITEAKLESALRSLNGSAAKVYASVPITEAWTVTEIVGELRRVGITYDLSRIQGCLTALVDQGLVKIVRGNIARYSRVEAKAKAAEPERGTLTLVRTSQRPIETLTTERKIMPDTNPFAEIVKRLREQAAAMNKLADDLEMASMENDEQLAGLEKLKQLKGLLATL